MFQEQTAGLYLTSPSGDSFTNPLFLFATCFAAKPSIVASEIPPVGGRSAEVWISPDPMRQFHSPYSYGPDPVNFVDPTGLYSVRQMPDGTFSRIDPAFDLFSDNNASVDVVVMKESMRNVFLEAGAESLIPEWSDLAAIALNHKGLLMRVGDLSSEFEYGAGFNRNLEMIPFTDGKPTTVHIPPGWENEVHGHPNGVGKLSRHGDVNVYGTLRMKHNMFVIGRGTGMVSVTNRKIMEHGAEQIPIGILK